MAAAAAAGHSVRHVGGGGGGCYGVVVVIDRFTQVARRTIRRYEVHAGREDQVEESKDQKHKKVRKIGVS